MPIFGLRLFLFGKTETKRPSGADALKFHHLRPTASGQTATVPRWCLQTKPKTNNMKTAEVLAPPPVGFADVQFADNPESRCACLILADNSGSMSGQPITELNAGLQKVKENL